MVWRPASAELRFLQERTREEEEDAGGVMRRQGRRGKVSRGHMGKNSRKHRAEFGSCGRKKKEEEEGREKNEGKGEKEKK